MKKFVLMIIASSTLAALTGCSGQDNDKVAERARLEGKTQAEEQLKKDRELLEEEIRKQKELQDRQAGKDRELQDRQVEKERELQSEQIRKELASIDTRAKSMEKSLTKLQDFYEDNSGVYEGTMIRGADTFTIRITLSPSIPRYSDSRVRTPAEIETDLTGLTFNAQILQWIPSSNNSVGCRINGLRPNTKRATLNIISPDCPSSYALTLNRTTIAGTAQSENNPIPFDIYAARTSKPIPARVQAPAKKATKKTTSKKGRR